MEPNTPTPNTNQLPQLPRRIPVRFPTVEPQLTYIILAIIGLVFFYTQSLNPLQLNEFQFDWAKINSQVYQGEYYRLFTSMFLHLDLMHWGFNSLALYIFGRDVERYFGHVRFAIIYVLGGLAGSLGSLIYTDAASIGASGAIFALFGAYGIYIYIHRHIYGEAANLRLRQLFFLAVFNIIIGFSPGSNIDNAAHLGGLFGGFILGWFIAPEFEPRQTPDHQIVMIDTNTPEKWAIMPVLFGVAIVGLVLFAQSTA